MRSYLNENSVELVAVSKTKPSQAIQELYDKGQRDFGENRVQELVSKKDELPADIRWHLIGHLQKNKVKYIADFVSMIHSVDNLSLANKIDTEALKHDRVIDILLQLKIAKEDSKFGYEPEDLKMDLDELIAMENIRIRGLMGMGTFTTDVDTTRSEFKLLKSIYDELRSSKFSHSPYFDTLSMGMSGDYQIAVEEGSTMVRIGSLIFGAR